MSMIYDNWEKLVEATLQREHLRQIARLDSLSSSCSSQFSSDSSLVSFSYHEIVSATRFFSDQNLIKRGHSGHFYIAHFQRFTTPLVVKRIDSHMAKRANFDLEFDFLSGVSGNSRFVHLMGSCLEGLGDDDKFLVFDYLPNRDLSTSLFTESGEDTSLPSLDWVTRLKIAREAAQGLAYLHHQCNPPLVHGDVQASSILLGHFFEVRLGSLSQLHPQKTEPVWSNKWTFTRKKTSGTIEATWVNDVYCLGKVLLELVTGKLGISSSTNTKAKELMEERLPYISIYDKKLVKTIVDPTLVINEDLLEEIWATAIIARACLNPNPSRRPMMKYVLKGLETPLKVVREE